MLGYSLSDLPAHALLKDGLYFVLLYIVWSLLYLQFTGKPLAPGPAPVGKMESINVTKGSQVFKLDPANITCIKASGDYVELVTGGESYLKQGTISFYEKALSQGAFVRIHRSIIINGDKIAAISGPAKGQYWIKMQDGQELRSSRRYRRLSSHCCPRLPEASPFVSHSPITVPGRRVFNPVVEQFWCGCRARRHSSSCNHRRGFE